MPTTINLERQKMSMRRIVWHTVLLSLTFGAMMFFAHLDLGKWIVGAFGIATGLNLCSLSQAIEAEMLRRRYG